MRKFFNENDEIEFRLVPYVGQYYNLQWRFKKPIQVLFLKFRDKWKGMRYYSPGLYTVDDNPDDYLFWDWRSFNLGKNSDIQSFETLKKNVKTKKELWEYYHVDDNLKIYERHREAHKKWLAELSDNIKKYAR